MLKIETIEVSGFEGAIKSMRNPYNSWDKSDSYMKYTEPDCFENCSRCECLNSEDEFIIGAKDMELCKKLIKAGSDHRKFLRMIHVQADVTAPLFWWKQFDTYKVGTVTNSCSTMHTITSKEFELSDFSYEGVIAGSFHDVLKKLNYYRDSYIKTKDNSFWYAIIKILPSSYNQLRTIDVDYETLIRMYHARKNHKLEEWHSFCDWIETLPYMKEFLNA